MKHVAGTPSQRPGSNKASRECQLSLTVQRSVRWPKKNYQNWVCLAEFGAKPQPTYFCQNYSWEISSLISWMRWGHPPWNNLNASISQVKNNWIDSRKGFPISNKYKVDPALIKNKWHTIHTDFIAELHLFFCRLTNFVVLLNSDRFHCSRRIQSNAQRLLTAFSGWFLKFQVFKFTLHVSYIIFIFHVLDCTYAQKNIAVSSYIWCF